MKACRLFADLLSDDPWEQSSVKFELKYKDFQNQKLISKCNLQQGI